MMHILFIIYFCIDLEYIYILSTIESTSRVISNNMFYNKEIDKNFSHIIV